MPLSVVDQIVNLHRAQLQGVIELGGVRKVRGLYEKARSEVEGKLAELRASGKGQTFGAHHLRQVLVQVADGLRLFQRDFGPQLSKQAQTAGALAQRHTVGAIKKLEKRYTGTEPTLRIEQAAVFREVYRGVEPSLLDRYHKLVGNYPMETIQRVRRDLALSLLTNESVDGAVNRIAAKGGIFDRERWRAERIVRTESQYSFGIMHQKCMDETAQEVPRLQKRLVATHDGREGEDSKQLDGQTVPFDKPFVWMKKTKMGVERVEYMQPPNRPNDRECVIPWRADYAEPKKAGPIEPEMPRGLPRT